MTKLAEMERLAVREAIDGKPAERLFEFVSFDLQNAVARLSELCRTPEPVRPLNSPVANAAPG